MNLEMNDNRDYENALSLVAVFARTAVSANKPQLRHVLDVSKPDAIADLYYEEHNVAVTNNPSTRDTLETLGVNVLFLDAKAIAELAPMAELILTLQVQRDVVTQPAFEAKSNKGSTPDVVAALLAYLKGIGLPAPQPVEVLGDEQKYVWPAVTEVDENGDIVVVRKAMVLVTDTFPTNHVMLEGMIPVQIPPTSLEAAFSLRDLYRKEQQVGAIAKSKGDMNTATSSDEDEILLALQDELSDRFGNSNYFGEPDRDAIIEAYGVKTRPDFFFEDYKVAIFYDGFYFHGGMEMRENLIGWLDQTLPTHTKTSEPVKRFKEPVQRLVAANNAGTPVVGEALAEELMQMRDSFRDLIDLIEGVKAHLKDDGKVYIKNAQGKIEGDKNKSAALTAAGYRVLRFTDLDRSTPERRDMITKIIVDTLIHAKEWIDGVPAEQASPTGGAVEYNPGGRQEAIAGAELSDEETFNFPEETTEVVATEDVAEVEVEEEVTEPTEEAPVEEQKEDNNAEEDDEYSWEDNSLFS